MHRFGVALGVLDRCDIDLAEVSNPVEREVCVPLSVGAQALDINLADGQRRLALEPFAFGYQFAVLGNVCRAGEHHIGRALAYSGGGIDVAAMHALTLLR